MDDSLLVDTCLYEQAVGDLGVDDYNIPIEPPEPYTINCLRDEKLIFARDDEGAVVKRVNLYIIKKQGVDYKDKIDGLTIATILNIKDFSGNYLHTEVTTT